MGRKRIAVLTSQPECAYMSQFMEGFLSEAFRLDYDVVVFAAFLKNGCSDSFKHGEMNIYTLCNLELFDGIVLIPECLVLGDIYEKISRKLEKEYKKPVIVVDRKDDHFTSIINRDDDAIEAIIDHVITRHHCSDIAFITGPKGHLHSEMRLQGYLRAMEKNGLKVNDSRIYYGDFWYDMGGDIVREMIAADNLPQAICCASDTMAISVVEALNEHNKRVPDEIIVTGYDSDGDGIRDYHSVTSLPRRNVAMGYEAIKTLNSLITGEPYIVCAQNYSQLDMIVETCGCSNFRRPLKATAFQRQFHTAYDFEGFDSGYNFMLEDMIGQDSLNDCLWMLSWYVYYLGDFEKFHLCLCDDWVDIEKYMHGSPRTDGYTDEMILALVRDKGIGSVDLNRRFKTKDILPELLEQNAHPSVYYCSPTHFNEICIGYTVLSLGESVESYDINFAKWSRFMNVALESIHRQLVTKHMYELMKKHALMDDLTGLYNRNGLYSISPKLIEGAVKQDSRLLVITGDLNYMKYINDNFGHGEGDEALKICAKAFLTATEELGGYTFRTGGDEFLYLNTGDYGIDEISKLINSIRENYRKFTADAGKPYPAQLALGYSCAKIQAFDTLDRLLSPADTMMFENKQKIKEESDFKYARK